MWAWLRRDTNLLKVGDEAPDFSAVANDGTTVHLQDYLGHGSIILYFYPKDDTPGCTKDACGIRDNFAEFKELNATVFGVSFDSAANHQKFIKKYNLPFQLLADTDKKISVAYGAARPHSLWASRITYVSSAQGSIARIFLKVNPAQHSRELLQGLAEFRQSPPWPGPPANPWSRPPGN